MFVSVIWPLIVSFLCYPYLIFIDGITKPNESEVIRQALVIELFLGIALELVIGKLGYILTSDIRIIA